MIHKKKFLSLLKKNIKLIGISSVCDFLFFLAFSFASLSFFTNIRAKIESIYQIIAEQSVVMQDTPDLESMTEILSTQKLFMEYFSDIMYYLVIYIILLFAAWMVFQGISWFIAHKILNKKFKPNVFVKPFAIISSLGLLAVFLIVFLSIKLSASMTKSIIPLLSQQSINGIITVLFTIVIYLLMIAYGMLQQKQWHKQFTKKAFSYPLKTGGTFVATVAILVLLNYTMMRLVAVHWSIFLIFTIILVLPSYTILRIYWISLLSTLKSK